MTTFDPLTHIFKVIAKISELNVFKEETSVVTIEDFSCLCYDDLKASLPTQPVYELRIVDATAQYVASGHTIDISATAKDIQMMMSTGKQSSVSDTMTKEIDTDNNNTKKDMIKLIFTFCDAGRSKSLDPSQM